MASEITVIAVVCVIMSVLPYCSPHLSPIKSLLSAKETSEALYPSRDVIFHVTDKLDDAGVRDLAEVTRGLVTFVGLHRVDLARLPSHEEEVTVIVDGGDVQDFNGDKEKMAASRVKWIVLGEEGFLRSGIKPCISSNVFLLEEQERDGFIIKEAYAVDHDMKLTVQEVERWSYGRGNGTANYISPPDNIWLRRSDLQGKRFQVGVVTYPPYLTIPDRKNLSTAYGFDMTLLSHLSTVLNFSVTLSMPKDDVFGSLDENK